MNFNKKPPEWRNAGVEPPDDLKDIGFQAGYKPPAAYFNWFFHSASQCIAELQTSFNEVSNAEIDALDDIIIDPDRPGHTGESISNDEIDQILSK